MSEQVYDVVQIAPQSGTFAAPGASVAAITILPVTDNVVIDLDRASQYPGEDYGRNVKNHAGRGYHGARGSSFTLPGELTYEQAMHLFEMSFAGGVTPTTQTVVVSSSSAANPSVITTATAHGLTSGQSVTIAGHSGSTPDINGAQTATVLSATTFSIAVNVTVAGTGGTVTTGKSIWLYPFEGGAPTLVPYTVEVGSETSQDQWEAAGVLIDELTIGYDDLDAPGAHPWTYSAACLGLTRAAAALTSSLSSTAVETMQGHKTRLYEGGTSTAFASLSELSASLVSFQAVFRRSLVRRLYGGTTDVATGWGFSEKSSAEITAKVKISSTSKSDIHDAWNSSGTVLGEKRWRIGVPGGETAEGTLTKLMNLDFRFGMLAVPIGDRDGERLYEVSGEIVDDSTLAAPAAATVTSGVSDLTP